MRIFKLIAAATVLVSPALMAAPAHAEGELTCWYDAEGMSHGADSTSSYHGIDASHYGTGDVVATSGRADDQAYAVVLTSWNDGNDCEATVAIPK